MGLLMNSRLQFELRKSQQLQADTSVELSTSPPKDRKSAFYNPLDGPDIDDLPRLGIFFRVTSARSHSPLCDDGYTATSDAFRARTSDGSKPAAGVTWCQMQRILEERDQKWSEDLLFSQNFDDEIATLHINGWRNSRPFPSDFISVTEAFEWAIRHIVRQLRDDLSATLSIIDGVNQYKKGEAGWWKVHEDAVTTLGAGFGEVKNFAWASSEVLILGRIFRDDILHTSVWTDKKPGFSPDEAWMKMFFLPKTQRVGQCWKGWLVFQPEDSFAIAKEKIERRMRELARYHNDSEDDSEDDDEIDVLANTLANLRT